MCVFQKYNVSIFSICVLLVNVLTSLVVCMTYIRQPNQLLIKLRVFSATVQRSTSQAGASDRVNRC